MTNLTNGCSSDLSALGLANADTNLTSTVQQYYPTVRQILCLQEWVFLSVYFHFHDCLPPLHFRAVTAPISFVLWMHYTVFRTQRVRSASTMFSPFYLRSYGEVFLFLACHQAWLVIIAPRRLTTLLSQMSPRLSHPTKMRPSRTSVVLASLVCHHYIYPWRLSIAVPCRRKKPHRNITDRSR